MSCFMNYAYLSLFLSLCAVAKGSFDNEIVDCVKARYVEPKTTFDPISQDLCRAYCVQHFPAGVYYMVGLIGSTFGNCYCSDEFSDAEVDPCGAPCDYKCPNQPTETCGSTDHTCASLFKIPMNEHLEYTAVTGVITSHGYPAHYLSYCDDTYTIIAVSLKRITLTFIVFETENGVDYLTIYTEDVMYLQLSGNVIPGPIELDAKRVKLELKTNEFMTFQGFRLEYSITGIPGLVDKRCKKYRYFIRHLRKCRSQKFRFPKWVKRHRRHRKQ